ncbi:hypothetical protein CASFOL_016256 [Castilleja foliolosa]|uniref:F-box domain-containing protein n=1 Tax=Castilleja foliolosa TaxID=1961234 RepID=A0ABD3DGD9_9LAMI
MNWSVPPISFPKWLLPYGFKTGAAAISSKTEYNHNGKDFISQLSDDLSISIVSRLRTKEAIRTSILSKRWRNIYKSMPNVDLNSESLVGTAPCSQIYFVTAANRLLKLCSVSLIRSLDLTCHLFNSNCDQYKSLLSAHCDTYKLFLYSLGSLLPGIERLSLHNLATVKIFSFSCHLISDIPSLTYLSLANCSLHQVPNLGLTQSNSLQELNLCGVTVLNGTLECILANCLSLHSLSMEICTVPSKLIFRGPNLELKSLSVSFCVCIEEIELCASNLATFKFESVEMVNIRFDHVPKLESMFLDYTQENGYDDDRTDLLIVKDLPPMKSFSFSTTNSLREVFSSLSMWINKFRNISQLSIHLHSTGSADFVLLARVFESCPRLQEFQLNTELVKHIDVKDVRRPPELIHPELKKVEIAGHSGTKAEIEFALYILESAICLEQMQISRCSKKYNRRGRWIGIDKPQWSKETLEMIHEQLQGQAISQNARLTIQHFYVSLNNHFPFNNVKN